MLPRMKKLPGSNRKSVQPKVLSPAVVKGTHLNSIKKRTSTQWPFLGYSSQTMQPEAWGLKSQISVFIVDQALTDFCLIDLCSHIFHPQHLGHGVPQFISISCEGSPSSIWFELASWETSNLSLCSPWNFSSWFTASKRSALNQAQYSPGCLIRTVKIIRIFSHSLQKIFLCIYLSSAFAFFFWAPQRYLQAFTFWYL